jgi:membrane-bound lytic murein transglycosylase MltF
MAQVQEKELTVIQQYKDFILAAANAYDWDASVIAAIMSRESRCGFALDEDLLGDCGHGHGLMQIDDRSFGPWLESHNWQDPAINIMMGTRILQGKYQYLKSQGIPEDDLLAASIAAYNCGEGNVWKVWRAQKPIDSRTTGGDYSADVLDRASQIVASNIFPEDEGDDEPQTK